MLWNITNINYKLLELADEFFISDTDGKITALDATTVLRKASAAAAVCRAGADAFVFPVLDK